LSCDSPTQSHRAAFICHVAIVWVIPAFGRYKLIHHEVTKSFRNGNKLLFTEMDTWQVLVLSKNQNNKLCNESAGS
jgi:hypothetical protein